MRKPFLPRPRPRFMASLPHELDGVKLTKHDLPAYVERVEALQELYIEENEARARYARCHQEAMDLAMRYRDEMDANAAKTQRYYDALDSICSLPGEPGEATFIAQCALEMDR